MFDTSVPVSITLRRPDGDVVIALRFPTDDELITHQRQRKLVIKQLGRGQSETSVPDAEEADAALIAKIRTDGQDGPPISDFEATRIAEQLLQCEVDDVTQEGSTFHVITRVPGALTDHVINMPSAEDVIKYRRQYARAIDMPHGRQKLTFNLAAVSDFYKKLCTDSANYSGPVPITHQRTALNAAIEESQRLQEPDPAENF